MAKKLTFYERYIKSCFDPETKADFTRREQYSKRVHIFNFIVLSSLLWLLIWKLISVLFVIIFEYDLWWFIELCFTIICTYLIINPLSKKMESFKKSFWTNGVWLILQILVIIYLINVLWLWIQKIENKTE